MPQNKKINQNLLQSEMAVSTEEWNRFITALQNNDKRYVLYHAIRSNFILTTPQIINNKNYTRNIAKGECRSITDVGTSHCQALGASGRHNKEVVEKSSLGIEEVGCLSLLLL